MSVTPEPHRTRGVSAAIAPVAAGFVCVLVGFASSYPIVVSAADAMGMTRDQLVTLTLALCVGMGVTTVVPSVLWRIPVVTAWSTPGVALLVTSTDGLTLPGAVGAFLLCGVLIVVSGVTGWFERSMARIPISIASALLAGVLVRFSLDAFQGLSTAFAIVAPMLAVWILLKRLSPRYCMPAVLITGVMAALLANRLSLPSLGVGQSMPVAIGPDFELAALLGVGLPLFVVTMASQNVPGVAVLRASGYQAPISKLMTITGVATVITAFFGVFALNLAAITAAICMGPDAHSDPGRRWLAAVWAGLFYLLLAVFAASLVDLFAAFPRELVIGIAGLALMPTIGAGLARALEFEVERDAAILTFVVAASGVSIAGIGSAFWAVILGMTMKLVMRPGSPPR